MADRGAGERDRVRHEAYGAGEVQSWRRGGREAVVCFDAHPLPITVKARELRHLAVESGRAEAAAPAPVAAVAPSPPPAPVGVEGTYERRVAMRTLEAMRLGVVPHDDVTPYTVGRDVELARVDEDLDVVGAEGGTARAFLADYGVGKTHLLELIQGRALARGFLVTQAVLDPRETQPSHPKRVYRALMRGLRYPDRAQEDGAGLAPLLGEAAGAPEVCERFGLEAPVGGDLGPRLEAGLHLYLSPAVAYWRTLEQLEDPTVRLRGVAADQRGAYLAASRDLLLDWIEGHPTVSNVEIDRQLKRLPGAHPRVYSLKDYRPWSRIYGYLLSGIAALARAVGYSGLVVLLDEAEFYALLSPENRAHATHLFQTWTGAAAGVDGGGTALPFEVEDLPVGGMGVQRRLPVRYGDTPGLYLGLAMTPNAEGLAMLEAALPESHVTTLSALGPDAYATLTRRVCDFYASAREDWTLPGPLVEPLVKVVQGLHGSGFIANPRHAMKFLLELLDVVRYHPDKVGQVVRDLQSRTVF